jgi:hypothetical protein
MLSGGKYERGARKNAGKCERKRKRQEKLKEN